MSKDIKRLIGDDGALCRGTIGTVQLPASGNSLPAGIYQIAAKGAKSPTLVSSTFVKDTMYVCVSKAATGSVIPVEVGHLFTPTADLTAAAGDTAYATTTILGDVLEVGEFYIAPNTVNVGSGDKFFSVTLEPLADVKSASLNVSAEEVDVTVAKDRFKKYRRGKFDADGSASFIYMKGTTDLPEGLSHQFYDIHSIDWDGHVTSVKQSDSPYLLVLYFDDDANIPDADKTYKLVTIFYANIFNFDYKGESSSAVSSDSKYRLAGSTDPVLYRVAEKFDAFN